MDTSLFTPTGTTALALSSLTLAGIGASVPAVADGILRRSRERYRAWAAQRSGGVLRVLARKRAMRRKKCSSGQERVLFEWAAELPRLASDGMLSKHELRLVAAANMPFSRLRDRRRPRCRPLGDRRRSSGNSPCPRRLCSLPQEPP